MAIKINFDKAGNPIPPTLCLVTRSGRIIGGIDAQDIDFKDSFMNYPEMNFVVHKKLNDEEVDYWDEITDLRLIYCEEWDTLFELTMELDEALETTKIVSCVNLADAELSQINLYNMYINEEGDTNWNPSNDIYKPTIFFDPTNTDTSLLHRLLKDKAPHYTIAHVDPTIANEQRMFAFNDVSIKDAFTQTGEEINCLIVAKASFNKDRSAIVRTISVYDLLQNCEECGYRGEFFDKCPKCGSTHIKYGYGEDTSIFISADFLSDGMQLTAGADSIKNCFKLEAGDDLMTETIRSCNPTGTDYLWKFSNVMKRDMSNELIRKLDTYDSDYQTYQKTYPFELDGDSVIAYNSLISTYKEYNEELVELENPIIGYSQLMNALYDVIDFGLYLESSLMPTPTIDKSTAGDQIKLLTREALSPIGVSNLAALSLASANNAIIGMTKVIVDPRFKVEIFGEGELTTQNALKVWKGAIKITNYSDGEDTAISPTLTIDINGDLETYTKQRLDKILSKVNTESSDIVSIFNLDDSDFKQELSCYSLNRLLGFKDACQACIDILIEQGISNNETWADKTPNLYEELFIPYENKLKILEEVIALREAEINVILSVENHIRELSKQTQDFLNLEKYLGNELWLEFCSYRRESKFSNTNYISDGLNNAELFKKALQFVEVATNEIHKASEFQYTLSTDLKGLILTDEKFAALRDYFAVGNWVRGQVDDEVYKVRLLDYSISFNDLSKIPIELSTATHITTSVNEVKDTLSRVSSMATSYNTVQRQMAQVSDTANTVNEWISDGLNAAFVQIKNNDSEEVTFTELGLMARSYDEITESFAPEQIRLTHNMLAYTDDNWNSIKSAIGKHDYKVFDESQNEFINKTGYGMSAEFVTAGVVSGSQIIGGNIYSDNYSNINATGSCLNLNDGTFSFAGGALKFDGSNLFVGFTDDSEIEAIMNIESSLRTANILAENLKVKAANINGQLVASQINTTGLIAENISATDIRGKNIVGSTFFVEGNKTFWASDFTEDDVDIIQNLAVKNIELTPEYLEKYDFNGDGNINSVEILQIQRMMEGTLNRVTTDTSIEICGENQLQLIKTNGVTIGVNGIFSKSVNANYICTPGIEMTTDGSVYVSGPLSTFGTIDGEEMWGHGISGNFTIGDKQIKVVNGIIASINDVENI